jgi:hypothetical protein
MWRDGINTLLRAHNLVLDVLGYSQFRNISGRVRMGTGAFMTIVTLTAGSPKAKNGYIIGHWYTEALHTGVIQIIRGALEAFSPYGRTINLSLGAVATLFNLLSDVDTFPSCPVGEFEDEQVNGSLTQEQWQRAKKNEETENKKHKDPDYPWYLKFLHLA